MGVFVPFSGTGQELAVAIAAGDISENYRR
jgi:hypothetical protein